MTYCLCLRHNKAKVRTLTGRSAAKALAVFVPRTKDQMIDVAPFQKERQWIWRPALRPKDFNGELDFYRVLLRMGRGLEVYHEPYSYRLDHRPRFCFHATVPDFWLPQSKWWPELNIEVTASSPQMGMSMDTWCRYLRYKYYKARRVEELYGVPTLVIHGHQLKSINSAHPRIAVRMVRVIVEKYLEHNDQQLLAAA